MLKIINITTKHINKNVAKIFFKPHILESNTTIYLNEVFLDLVNLENKSKSIAEIINPFIEKVNNYRIKFSSFSEFVRTAFTDYILNTECMKLKKEVKKEKNILNKIGSSFELEGKQYTIKEVLDK